MKAHRLPIAVLAAAVLFSSATSHADAPTVCGYSDRHGNIVIEPQFEDEDVFSGGVAAAKSDGKWGYIDKQGQWVVKPTYDKASNASEGFGVVERDGKRAYLNLKTPAVMPDRWYEKVSGVRQGLGLVQINGKWGYANPRSGELIIPAIYDDAFDFTADGLATVDQAGQRAYIDKTGKRVITSTWDTARDFSEGRAVVKQRNKWGYIDRTGKVVIPISFDADVVFRDGLATVKHHGKWGYIDKQGQWAIPARFDDVVNFGSGRAFAHNKAAEDYFLIDKAGKALTKPIFSAASQFNDGIAYVKVRGGEEGLIDTQGRWVLPFSKLPGIKTRVSDDNNKYLHDGLFGFCMTAPARLFGASLDTATRAQLRQAAKAAGAKPTREEDRYYYDLYDATGLLKGATKLQIGYVIATDQFAHAMYIFDSFMDKGQVKEVVDMVASKYGEGARDGNYDLGPVSVTWDIGGISIKVSRGWPSTTTYLEYTATEAKAQMQAEIDAGDAAEKAKERKKLEGNF